LNLSSGHPLHRSSGFSRIRLFRQDATVPAAIHRLKPGLQYVTHSDYRFNVHPAARQTRHDFFAGTTTLNVS
jgi:hypothetical protein